MIDKGSAGRAILLCDKISPKARQVRKLVKERGKGILYPIKESSTKKIQQF